MPLSDEEQKILKEIEAQLNASDPDLVEQVTRTTLYRHAARAIRWAVVLFIGGLVLLVLTFANSLYAAFVGFLMMLGALFAIERNVRKLGKAGFAAVTGEWTERGGWRGIVGQSWRGRFRRDDD